MYSSCFLKMLFPSLLHKKDIFILLCCGACYYLSPPLVYLQKFILEMVILYVLNRFIGAQMHVCFYHFGN